MTTDPRTRAKDVIFEIARQSSGDAITGKVRLFKAFYIAHLYYAMDQPGYLSEWPIVRMPMGPGIDDFDSLIDDLVAEGRMEVDTVRVGPFRALRFCARAVECGCDEGLVDAVRQAVEFVSGKTGAELSEITHEYSESWKTSEDGSEMNIYQDLLDEDEKSRQRRKIISNAVDEAFG